MLELQELKKMLFDGTAFEMKMAIDTIHDVEDKRKLKPLLEPLMDVAQNDRNCTKRRAAIAALGEIGDKRATDLLLKILKEGASLDEANVSLKQLFEDGPFSMSRMSGAFTSELPKVRTGAAIALGLVGYTRAVQPLIDTLQNDWAWNVKGAAAIALGVLGNESAIPVLQFVAKTDSDEFVREQAQEALLKLKK